MTLLGVIHCALRERINQVEIDSMTLNRDNAKNVIIKNVPCFVCGVAWIALSSTTASLNKKSKAPWESETKVKVKHAWQLYDGYVPTPGWLAFFIELFSAIYFQLFISLSIEV